MGDVRDFVIIDGLFQCCLIADVAGNDIDLILDIARQGEIHAIVHEHRAQTVAYHQTRRHRTIDAHAAGDQILHASLLRAKTKSLASSADRFRSGSTTAVDFSSFIITRRSNAKPGGRFPARIFGMDDEYFLALLCLITSFNIPTRIPPAATRSRRSPFLSGFPLACLATPR